MRLKQCQEQRKAQEERRLHEQEVKQERARERKGEERRGAARAVRRSGAGGECVGAEEKN